MPIVHAEYSSVALKAHHGLPIVEYLALRFPYRSALEWKAQVDVKNIFINNKVAYVHFCVQKDDEIKYVIPDFEEPEVDTDVQILFEDAEFLVVHKPAGMPVSRTSRIVYNTLVHYLRRIFDNEHIYLLHRLDKETSGVIVCAKTQEACQKWQKKINSLIEEKFYLAVVNGNPEWEALTCLAPLAEQDGDEISARMLVLPEGKKSQTEFYKLKYSENSNKSLILCRLHTGRKHQIRAHLAYIGFSIVGDKIYSHQGKYFLKHLEQSLPLEDFEVLGAEHHLLHAYQIHLKKEYNEKAVVIQSKNFSKAWHPYLKEFPGFMSVAHKIMKQY